MSRHLRLIVFAALPLLALAFVRAAEPARLTPQEGMLLLRNGEVLAGRVTQAGDHWIVTLPRTELRLRREEVDAFCYNIAECYQRKRARMDPSRVQEHLELADWCLAQDYLDGASQEIETALSLDNTHPKIAVLQRRLEVAREKPISSVDAPTASNDGLPSNDELDRLVAGMPHGTVESFATAIQPLLLNSCSTSKCHGPSSTTNLRLLRMQTGSTASRRLTQRNLYQALTFVDRSEPGNSPLLAVPLTPHGNLAAPIFGSTDAPRYQQLARWVFQVAQTNPQSMPAPNTASKQTKPLGNDDSQIEPATFEEEMPAAKPHRTGLRATTPKKLQRVPAREAAPAKTADEFDPKTFNERYKVAPPKRDPAN